MSVPANKCCSGDEADAAVVNSSRCWANFLESMSRREFRCEAWLDLRNLTSMGGLRFTPGVCCSCAGAWLYTLFFSSRSSRRLFYSFFDWNGFEDAVFVGLSNYRQLLHDTLFRQGIGRVAEWALAAVVFKVGIALVLASMLRVPIRGSRVFTAAFFVPVIISSAAISLLLRCYTTLISARGMCCCAP